MLSITNKNAVRGDILPILTFLKLPGVLMKIVSMFQSRLKMLFKRITKENIITIYSPMYDTVVCNLIRLVIKNNAITAKNKNEKAVEGAMGIYKGRIRAKDRSSIIQPYKAITEMIITNEDRILSMWLYTLFNPM